MSSEYDVDNYRVFNLVHPAFDDSPVSIVDFTLHLKPQITLEKKITKDIAGRPVISEYFYDDEKIADIHFEISVDPNTKLMYRRKEILHYVKYDGTDSPNIIIKDRMYDFTNLDDLELVMAERETARVSILSRLKAFSLGVIQQYNPTSDSDAVVLMVRGLWNETASERDNFIELGDNSLRDYFAAIDLGTTPHTWLGYDIGGGVTIRDYYVSRLTF